ncbi:MAG: hypothetical protein AB1324_05615 [Candidatus Micrarchaeota archaeon]
MRHRQNPGGGGKPRHDLREEIERLKTEAEEGPGFARKRERLAARQVAWGFAQARESLRDELSSLARIFESAPPRIPADFDTRIARASIAMYLIEKCDELLAAATERKSTPALLLYKRASAAAMRVLDKGFFGKSAGDIIRQYLAAEVEFTACAEHLGVPLLTLEQAVRAYKGKVADSLDSINGTH